MIVMRDKKTPALFLFIATFLVLGFFYSNGFCQAKPATESSTDKIVAMVNERPIYESALSQEVDEHLEKYSKFGVKKPTPELLHILNKRALDAIIDEEVFSQALGQYTIADIDQKAQKELDSLKTQYKTREEFDKYLKMRRLTEEELLASLQYKLRVDAYLESQGILHFEPAAEEIHSFYDQSKGDMFQKKERVRVRHILIQVEEGADQSTKDAARQKAEDIRSKVKSGQDFATLAEKHSDCLSSNQRGGELGFVEKGFMPPEFEAIAFSIEKDTISEVVYTKHGYHIIQVLEKEPAGYTSLDQVRDFIIRYLEDKHLQRLRREHLKNLRQQAKIEIFIQ